jgi:hypothetical protein
MFDALMEKPRLVMRLFVPGKNDVAMYTYTKRGVRPRGAGWASRRALKVSTGQGVFIG